MDPLLSYETRFKTSKDLYDYFPECGENEISKIQKAIDIQFMLQDGSESFDETLSNVDVMFYSDLISIVKSQKSHLISSISDTDAFLNYILGKTRPTEHQRWAFRDFEREYKTMSSKERESYKNELESFQKHKLKKVDQLDRTLLYLEYMQELVEYYHKKNSRTGKREGNLPFIPSFMKHIRHPHEKKWILNVM